MMSELANRRLIALVTSFVFSTVMALDASAVCESSGSGSGGTGITDETSIDSSANARASDGLGRDPESGAGGTGLRGGDDEGSGAGGTGYRGGDDEGSGAGGTGILGTITGFGSVCVNGLRVAFDDATPVMRDGEQIPSHELAVGQVVRIVTRGGLPLMAREITVEDALAGPVTRVEPGRSRVWVMDQPVELQSNAAVFDRIADREMRLDALVPGRRVSVSGHRRSDGVVFATRIESRREDRPDSATGVAIAATDHTAYVGDLRATLTRDTQMSDVGNRVLVEGRWNAESRTLEHASLRAASPAAGDVERLSLEGFVDTPRSGSDFDVAGTPIDASGLDRTPDRGAFVRVHGRLDRDGRMHAEQIEMRRVGQGFGTHSVREDGRNDKSDRSGRSGRGDREDREDRSGRDRAEREDRSGRADRSDREDRSGRN